MYGIFILWKWGVEMTEKEKRDRGFLYNANYDEEILNEINRCNDLCHEFNQIKPSDRESQSAGRIIAKVVLSILQLSHLCSPFRPSLLLPRVSPLQYLVRGLLRSQR